MLIAFGPLPHPSWEGYLNLLEYPAAVRYFDTQPKFNDSFQRPFPIFFSSTISGLLIREELKIWRAALAKHRWAIRQLIEALEELPARLVPLFFHLPQ